MKRLTKIGRAALWIYTNHLLVFAIGGLLVGFETLILMAPYMATPSPSYTLGLVMGLTAASAMFCGAKLIDRIRKALAK